MAADEDLGRKLAELEQKIAILERATQMQHSTVETAGGAVGVGDVVATTVETAAALPGVEEQAGTAQAVADSVAVLTDDWDSDLDARLEDAAADLDDAQADLEDAQQEITDAFGQRLDGLSDRVDEVVAGANGTLILFSDEEPSGTAPTGSTWFMINEAENVVGQWQQTGTKDDPVWTPREIESSVIANLDVGKLSAGQAAIAEVVAMKIAASTASIQTVNVENLFVTSGATMRQAVIDYLFANVVTAKKITTDMLDVNTFNGVTLTGALIKSAATGKRVEMLSSRFDIYDEANRNVGRMEGTGGYFTFTTPSGPIYFGAAASPTGPGLMAADTIRGESSVASNRFILAGATLADYVLFAPSEVHAGLRLTINHLRDNYDGSYFYEGRGTAGAGGKSTLTADRFRFGDGTDPFADTGWVPLVPSGAYAADQNLAVRLVGKEVEMRGQVKLTAGGAIGAASGQLKLPSLFCPTQAKNKLSACQGTAYTKVVVQTSGNVDWTAPSATAAYVAFDDVKFMIG